MMRHGPLVMIIGAILIGSGIVIVYPITSFPSPESIFDSVSEKVRIDPGTAYSFSQTTISSQVPMMWGLHITDYQPNDKVSITISNVFGDKLGSFEESDPIFIKSFMIPKVDTYNFNVENKGQNPVTVIMMFTENPAKSKMITDPNSPLYKTILPVAVSVILLIVGVLVLLVGIIFTIMDWKKGKNKSRYV